MILNLKMAFLSFIASSLAITTVKVTTQETINEPYVYFFVVLGIIVTLGKDFRDQKKKEQMTLFYVLWSIILSVGFSFLTILAYEEGLLSKFQTYAMVVFVSSFSPLIIDRYSNVFLEKLGKFIIKIPEVLFNMFFKNGK